MSKQDFQVNNYFKPSSDEATENSIKYDWLVRELVDNDDDYFWLSDKLAEVYDEVKRHDYVCSARACMVDVEGGWSAFYASRISSGGRIDKKKINHSTGNSFWIGFNYGH